MYRTVAGSIARVVGVGLVGLLAATSPSAFGDADREAPEKPRIEEDFEGAYDKALWKVDWMEGSVDPTGEQLRMLIPPGPEGRAPAVFEAAFRVEGDFDIRCDYTLIEFPSPAREWLNAEIFVEGPDGAAAVIRTDHSQEGSGYTMWFEPAPEREARGAWRQVATSDQVGKLRLERTGGQLDFQVAGPGEVDFRTLGRVPFGTGPITKLAFRVVAPELNAPVEVLFDNIQIEADRLIEPTRPNASRWGLLGRSVAIFVLLAGAAAIWYRLSRRRPAVAADSQRESRPLTNH